MKNINDILKECAEADGLYTYMYARMGEANRLMDDVRQFPVLLRQFDETISETRIIGEERRTGKIYFCDALGDPEPDTESEVSPVVERMKMTAFSFLGRLRSMGVQVDVVTDATPFYARFDALVAGVSMTISMTYNVC